MGEPGKKLPKGLPQPGQIVMDRYRVERLVGTGGMAHVLAAKHVTLDQEVAIKILDPFLISDQDARERFAREARAMATLTSKYTVRVYDVGAMPNGLPFMVMELLNGHDLHQELQRRGPLPLDEAVEHMEQVCQAVAEAHSKGIIHRDLKPQNLFLTKVKGKSVVRVLDFGIARITGAIKVETITRMGDVVGTLQYMSPEQIKSSKSVDPRSDVWSLGACLYKLITGWPPYPQAGEAPLMSAILTSPPKPITDYRNDVPAILMSVIARCLRREPNERFPSAGELRKALEEVQVFFATADDYNEKTDVMASAVQQKATQKASSDPRMMMGGTMALPEVPVPSDSGRRSAPADFNKTIPLNSPVAAQLMAEHAAMQRERESSPQMARPSTPMQPISGSHGPISRPPVSRPPMSMSPMSNPPMSHPRSQSLQRTVPGQHQRHQSSSLSFVMIVVAVAIGVFIAGIGLFLVLSRTR